MSATTTTPTRQTQIVESIFIDPGLVRLALLAVMGPIVRVCMCKHVHPKYTNTPQENGIKTLSNRPSSCPIVFLLIFCLFFFLTLCVPLNLSRSQQQKSSSSPESEWTRRSTWVKLRQNRQLPSPGPGVRSQSVAIMLLCSPKSVTTTRRRRSRPGRADCTVFIYVYSSVGSGFANGGRNSEGT